MHHHVWIKIVLTLGVAALVALLTRPSTAPPQTFQFAPPPGIHAVPTSPTKSF